MKRVLLVSLGLIAMATYAGCLPEEGTTPTGTAGKGGSNATAGTGGSDNTAGTGGSDATAGTGGSDNTAGTGGSVSTAGTGGGATAGTGGGVGGTGGGVGGTGGSTGGRGGTGGTGGGVGGTGGGGRGGTGGTAGGTGGSIGGRGGTTGTAGTGGGTAGTGGAAGLPTIPELFPVTSTTVGSFDGRLVVMPCGDNNEAGTDCGGGGAYYSTAGAGTTAQRITCTGSALNVNQVFNVGGETGRMYQVSVHFYGIAEPKVYGTVTREAGTGRPANTEDTTGAGATPTAWATATAGHTYTASDYNTNEIRVCRTRACATADETAVYYLNADTSQGHWSYVINYEKTITVVGGGSIRVRNYDQNCRQIKNCGPANVAANQCATMSNRRVINVSAASPAPSTAAAAMGGLSQPALIPERTAGSAGQWLLIDVTRVISVQ